jgi:hypothetical protein
MRPKTQPSKHGAENTNYSPGEPVSFPLLLDEMFSEAIAQRLRAKGHDVQAVVADPSLASLPDDQILARAAATGRALVTANIKDFMPLDAQYRAAGQAHAGLIPESVNIYETPGRGFYWVMASVFWGGLIQVLAGICGGLGGLLTKRSG